MKMRLAILANNVEGKAHGGSIVMTTHENMF